MTGKRNLPLKIFWMNVEIITTDIFVREAKGLIKKYHSLKAELVAFEDSLSNNPKQGTLITENV